MRLKGPGEKGVPRSHPEISSQELADFECRFPYDSYGRGALFRRSILGQYPAAPCSPGPFVLLLKSARLSAIRNLKSPRLRFLIRHLRRCGVTWRTFRKFFIFSGSQTGIREEAFEQVARGRFL